MRRHFLLIFIWLLPALAVAQNNKVDFSDGEFFFAAEDYEEALYAYKQVYDRDYQDNAYINYRMGVCLLNIPGRKAESVPYLEVAAKNIDKKAREGKFGEEHAPPDALLYLGNAYRINMDTEKAISAYNTYAEHIDANNFILQRFVDQQILSCGNALISVIAPVSYTVGNLGQLNETHTNRYNMVVSNDLKAMAFMGKNPFYNGVYVATKPDKVWTRPLNITPSIVSEGNMDVVALSPDGKTMLLTVSDEFDGNIFSSVYANNRWNPAQSLGKPINSKYFESYAAFSPDGKSIYFTSNRKESLGGMDIFRTDMLEDSTWSEPVNLEAINTELNEEAPYISPDGKRLYFSSQGHSTIGGFDVFYSELQEDGTWSDVPVNIGYPLNTTDDDFTLTPGGLKEDGVSFLFAQEKVPGYDIFKFEMIQRDATPVPVAMDEVEEVEEPVAEVTPEPEPEPEVVAPPEKYLLRPIYFGFDSYALTAEGMAKLDGLSGLFEKYNSMKLEIRGHTDAVGDFDYNQRLSDRRANAVAKYLVLQGVAEERLQVTGLSESEPEARNRTKENRDAPDGRMLNRRVQFRVTITEDVIIEMEKVEVPDHLKLDD